MFPAAAEVFELAKTAEVVHTECTLPVRIDAEVGQSDASLPMRKFAEVRITSAGNGELLARQGHPFRSRLGNLTTCGVQVRRTLCEIAENGETFAVAVARLEKLFVDTWLTPEFIDLRLKGFNVR